MPSEFNHRHRVAFSETDMAGITHFSTFYRMMEDAEHAFYRSLGFSVVEREADQVNTWPRVQADCQFLRPIRFEDEVDVRLLIDHVGTKSVRYLFDIRLAAAASADAGAPVAWGAMSVVHAIKHPDGAMRGQPIPDRIRALLQPATRDLIDSLKPPARN